MKRDKQQWLTLINAQQESGLTIVAFCRDNNINHKHFYYHRSQSLKGPNPSPFIQAKLPAAKRPASDSDKLTLQCGNGQLQLSANVSAVWLASLMKALA